MKTSIINIILLAAAMTLASCSMSDRTSDMTKACADYTYRKNVVFLTDEQMQHLQGAEKDKLVFDKETHEDLLPSRKNIIILREDNRFPFLATDYKIKSIKRTKEGITYKIKPASIDDVFTDPCLLKLFGRNY